MGAARIAVIAVVAIGIGGMGVVPPTAADEPKPERPRPRALEDQQRLELMKSKGTRASLTILPVRLGGRPWDRVSEVVGLLLEQQGLEKIELGKTAFEPATKADPQGLAASVGKFVKGHTIATEYALYAEINGNREVGLNELRVVVVDKAGAVVWTDIHRPQGNDRDPMSLCVLLVQRLSPQLSLNEETAKAAKPGRMAAIMNERSGMPPENERATLPERQKRMKESRHRATMVIFPVRMRGMANTESATDLAKLIKEAGLCKAVPAKESVLLKASQADPNELKTLWTLAREFRDYSRKNTPDADYVLYADYVFNPRRWEQGFVHFVVCDRKGEWVIVDMQNSHHPDYQSIKPTSREGCDKLLIKRLGGYLR
ncbi:MAG: hypothetical protein WAU84_25755 [Thermoguttaceae bacterium]